jgi:hypothetical protein
LTAPVFLKKRLSMNQPALQVKNDSVLTDRFREVNGIPEDASDIQITVGMHATKIVYSMPYVPPVITPVEAVTPVVKKKTSKKKIVKKDD